MLKKFTSLFLAAIILTVASGTQILAQTNAFTDAKTSVKGETADSARDSKSKELKSLIETPKNSASLNISNKSTLADYERGKRQGKGFSTATKVLIGVGIAAAVIGIVVFAASRDKVRTF